MPLLRIRIALGVALDKGIEILASYHRTESLKNPKPVGFHGLRVWGDGLGYRLRVEVGDGLRLSGTKHETKPYC